MTSQPVWLLDFDGVINALSRRGGQTYWQDWQAAHIDHPHGDRDVRGNPVRLPLLWSPAVIETVAAAVDAGVSVRWLSTWREHTRLLPPILSGLPEIPWLDENILAADAADGLDARERMVSGPWKVAVARAAVPDDAPLLWTEDALSVDMLSESWRRARTVPTMFVRPHPAQGLIPRDVRAVREWIADYAPRP